MNALCLPALLAALGLPDTGNLDAPAPPRQQRAPMQEPAPAVPRPAPATLPRSLPLVARDGWIAFRNRDVLHGRLISITPATDIVEWRTPEAAAVLPFSISNAVQIALGDASPTQETPANVQVVLTNGDSVRGRLVALEADRLRLDTALAGRMELQRAMIRRLVMLAGADTVILDGLESLDGWTVTGNREQWTWQDGALLIPPNGAIGRDVGLPDRCSVEFELSWTLMPALQVSVYSTQPGSRRGMEGFTGYLLSMIGANVQVMRARQDGFELIGSAAIPQFAQPSQARIALFTDRNQKTIELHLDGQLLKSWIDPVGLDSTGTCVNVISQNGANQKLRLRNFRVRHWSGNTPTGGPIVPGKETVVTLANGDRVSGQLTTIRDGVAALVTSAGPLTVPVERIVEVYLPVEGAERARRMARDVIGIWDDGSRLTFELLGVNDRHVTGQSENFGKAEFTRGPLRELLLRIYDEDRLAPKPPNDSRMDGPLPDIMLRQLVPFGE